MSAEPDSYLHLAERVISGDVPTRDEMRQLLAAPDDRLPELLDAAQIVREAHFGRGVRIQMLVNAKSGKCGERCGYCSQSKDSRAEVPVYPMIADDEILAGARLAAAGGACRYCIVTSGRIPAEAEIERLCAVVGRIRVEAPALAICCSIGMVTVDQARRLRDAGVTWMNHNTNTSERHYQKICSSHDYADRLRTIEAIRAAGLNTCSGGIVGMGEDDADLVEMAFTCRELDVDAIPVNFFYPVAGTPLAEQPGPSRARCLKALCLFRLVNPDKEIRVAAGREHYLGDEQGLALQAANALFAGGYLTTSGDSLADTRRMIVEAGFVVDTAQG